jgi:methylmalonyl-CoA mutase C-terminal domain/subunit
MNTKKIKVLIAKPGLDGHDRGAKVVVRALMDAGFDVTYTGLRKTPEEIARAAADHDVDVIGLSSMAGSHIPLCRNLKPWLEKYDLTDKLWIIGGVIPNQDFAELQAMGLDGIFPIGSSFDDIINFINGNVS